MPKHPVSLEPDDTVEVQVVLSAVLKEPQLRYSSKGSCRNIQTHKTSNFGHPNTLLLKVRELPSLGLVVRVRNTVSRKRTFS